MYEITRQEIKTILINLKYVTVLGEDYVHPELYKYGLEKFKTELLKFFNFVSGTTPPEWNIAIVLIVR